MVRHFSLKKFLMLNATCLILFTSSFAQKISHKAIKALVEDSAVSTGHIGISVYDPATGKYLCDYNSSHYFIPASNTKLFSCYAGMKYLGDSLTGILYDDAETNFKILGNGDPTFLHPDYKKQPVFDFIKNLKQQSLMLCQLYSPKSTAPVIPLGMGWAWDDYNSDYVVERNFFPIYGNLATFALQNNQVAISPAYFNKYSSRGQWDTGTFKAERSIESNFYFISRGTDKKTSVPFKTGQDRNTFSIEASLLSDTVKKNIEICKTVYQSIASLKKIHSQPTDSLLKPMMHRSDNFFAEQTLLMVSNELFGYMNERNVIDSLLGTDLKDVPQKPKWVDGSGLSRYNLFTPQDFVFILDKMKNEFGLERMKNILPTGGEGTIRSYYQNLSGNIFVKTGTLSNNCALSGYLITKKGKLYIFSILANNYITAATPVRRAVEQFINYVYAKY